MLGKQQRQPQSSQQGGKAIREQRRLMLQKKRVTQEVRLREHWPFGVFGMAHLNAESDLN
jgi:hypothetical protein